MEAIADTRCMRFHSNSKDSHKVRLSTIWTFLVIFCQWQWPLVVQFCDDVSNRKENMAGKRHGYWSFQSWDVVKIPIHEGVG